MPHPTRVEVMDAVAATLAGDPAGAARLAAAWADLPADDLFHRCVVAHYLADAAGPPPTRAAPDSRQALHWDTLALAAALEADPSEFDGRFPGMTHAAFLPSLHLNLAASHERLGAREEARRQALAALAAGAAAGEDPGVRHALAGATRLLARLAVPPRG